MRPLHRRFEVALLRFPVASLLACGGCGGDAKAGQDPAYGFGGELSGRAAGRTVPIESNGTDTLTLDANGTLRFAQGVAADAVCANFACRPVNPIWSTGRFSTRRRP
jgi:hypothetical protein